WPLAPADTLQSGEGWRTVLHEDHRGRLWLATPCCGLWLLNGDAKQREPVIRRRFGTRDGLPSMQVRDFVDRDDGALWTTTPRGLVRSLDGAASEEPRFEVFTTANGLASDDLTRLGADGDGNLWLATTTAGVMRVTSHGFSSWTRADGIRSSH